MKRATSYIPWDEFQRLVRELKEKGDYRYAYIILMGTMCALRISDLLSIKWVDMYHISEKEPYDELILREKKTNKERKITINQGVKPFLRDYFKKKYKVMTNPYDKIINISTQSINERLKTLFAEHNIDYKGNISTHMFRKTYGRKIYNDTEDKQRAIIMLNRILKHATIEQTVVYLGIRDEEIAEMIENIELDI